MNNNKTMKYNKTQEINYKKKRMGLFLWGNLGVSLIRGLCEWRGIHSYIDTKMLTSQMHYFCSTAEPENKRRPSRQRELGSNLLSLSAGAVEN